MNTVRIIACLDVDGGRVMKGVQFVDLVDAGDPAELAARYDGEGADEVVFLDITASSGQRDTMIDVVERTADSVFIPLTVGGGIRTVQDARRLLRAGADKVGINSAAIAKPDLIDDIAAEFGSQCVVVAIDAKTRSGSPDFEVIVHGGRTQTGRDVVEWAAECNARGAGEILLTSMDRDGTQLGYDLALTSEVSQAVNVPVIASGGVGSLDDFLSGAHAGADGLLAASIFHFRTHTISEVKQHLMEAGIQVRPA